MTGTDESAMPLKPYGLHPSDPHLTDNTMVMLQILYCIC